LISSFEENRNNLQSRLLFVEALGALSLN